MTQPQYGETFLQEAEDLLQQVEEVALELEARPDDSELVNVLFRTFHTVKGSGSMFGFDAVASFTHGVETALDHMREGRLGVSHEFVSLLLAAKDHIRALLRVSPGGTPELDVAGASIARAIDALYADTRSRDATAEAPPSSASATGEGGAEERFRVSFRLEPSGLEIGLDPACLLRDLRELGSCTFVSGIEEPPAPSAFTEEMSLTWELFLTTRRGEHAVRDVFIFLDDGAVTIERVAEPVAEAPAAPSSIAQKPATPIEPAAKRPAAAQTRAGAAQSLVRVPSERLDQLVNLVGELVINQSRLNQACGQSGSQELSTTVEAMERLVSELRDSVLGIRMMPIGATFSRFQRLVRDLSGELGREAELVTAGAETELDKTMIDQLGDPLVHLIRNSMDHGLEPPAERLAKGKPSAGTLKLSASHEGAHVVITLEDDGRGLDAAAIRAKAEAKGLVSADAHLTEQETFNLAFAPGLSTARALSNISGRGVGLDAVKRAIDDLRGTISLSSVPGRGTAIRLTLPLTLAIIDGLLVEIEGDRFILPMAAVMETVELTRGERRASNGRNLITVRGELVPYLRMRDVFELGDGSLEFEKVVIVGFNGQRLGLVVDRVLGSHQTVIQSLGRFYQKIELFSGTTIMGDGRVAIIIDVAGVVRYADRKPASRRPAAA